MDNTAQISVIIPAYNTQNHVKQTVNSVTQQTYNNIETIIVDDGSMDSTAEIGDALALCDSRLVCIHQKNAGIFQSRLHGIGISVGRYIGFIDSDDLMEADMYERLVANAIKENADISHCGYKVVNNGTITEFYGTGKRWIHNRTDGIIELVKGDFIEPTACTKLYRREIIDHIDVGMRIDNYEDLLLNYIAFTNGEHFIYEDITPYHYIQWETSYCHKEQSEKQDRDAEFVIDYLVNNSRNTEYAQYVLGRENIEDVRRYNEALRSKQRDRQKMLQKRIKCRGIGSIPPKKRLQIKMISNMSGFYNFFYSMIIRILRIE